MQNCPICGEEVGVYHELTFKEPYTHNNPFDGMHNPATKSPTDEYYEMSNEQNWQEEFDDDDNEFQRCSKCDGHDACEDFGCAFKAGLGHLVENDDLPF